MITRQLVMACDSVIHFYCFRVHLVGVVGKEKLELREKWLDSIFYMHTVVRVLVCSGTQRRVGTSRTSWTERTKGSY